MYISYYKYVSPQFKADREWNQFVNFTALIGVELYPPGVLLFVPLGEKFCWFKGISS